MTRLLDDDEVDKRMSHYDLVDWRREGGTLRRTIDAYDFPTAVHIVQKIVVEAQKLDHHPDIDIRGRTLHFTLSSEGGLSDADVELAQRIETAAGTLARGHD
ncbi:4a-hydroxytetrahydrobiopterin dehydratase [Streptomyces sp. PTM05]|uniref:Putative pterin-4-alpha-carbinolamine dehydratase n=1 Tax=Streptantibioticus parmotrematis TaxID=2873249 RepID=A0ABS7QS83_9ACTN|nr:4a-hydroxytetrahydrobiopterin dehydratase [Streptantibioticus parmotrematis]MBY8885544.1 4a-hydroxytetrahydrobiopterin dehydratase [Streptantibioticus parmotrematis]